MKSWGSEPTLKRVTFVYDNHVRDIVSSPPPDASDATTHDSTLDGASSQEEARSSMKSWGSEPTMKRVTFAFDNHVQDIVSSPNPDESEATTHDSILDGTSSREKSRASMMSWGSEPTMKRVSFANEDDVREVPRVGRGRRLSMA
jgi:hypothetical protein